MSVGRSTAQRPNPDEGVTSWRLPRCSRRSFFPPPPCQVSFSSLRYGYYKPRYRSYSYHKPHCYTVTRPVTIRVWSDYSYAYIFRTVYRDIKICN